MDPPALPSLPPIDGAAVAPSQGVSAPGGRVAAVCPPAAAVVGDSSLQFLLDASGSKCCAAGPRCGAKNQPIGDSRHSCVACGYVMHCALLCGAKVSDMRAAGDFFEPFKEYFNSEALRKLSSVDHERLQMCHACIDAKRRIRDLEREDGSGDGVRGNGAVNPPPPCCYPAQRQSHNLLLLGRRRYYARKDQLCNEAAEGHSTGHPKCDAPQGLHSQRRASINREYFEG